MIEFSNKMETIETFKPALDASGKFIGLDHEAIFYDPILSSHQSKQPIARSPGDVDDPNRRYTFIECVSNIQNTDGRPTQLTNADPRFVDYYGRPWAKNWEKYFEKDWEKPDAEEVPKEILDIFK
jgi:hypothetical protein